MDSQADERTPLLENNSNRNQATSLLPSVDFEGQNNITFYEYPQGSPYSNREQNLRNLGDRTNSRSDESQLLATLAVDKKMSDPRRTFCLFVTFDFILTILLWLIEIGTSSTPTNGFFEILSQQMKDYDAHTSLFDVVMLACVRFIFLVITYALFRIRHYWPIAISTAISDAAFLLKVFCIFALFGSIDVSSKVVLNVPMSIVFLLTSFILTWIEVWFVDFKVLPSELKLAQKTAQAVLQPPHRTSLPIDDMFFRRVPVHNTPSVFEGGRFYTPPPSESGYTGVESMYYSIHGFHKAAPPLTPQQTSLLEQGKDGIDKLWSLYQNNNIWKVEKTLNGGDIVHSTEDPCFGKTFKITATIIGRTPDVIVRDIILKPEEMPIWNKSVSEVKILQRIGEQTCITLEVSAPAAMGLIASREFITVRRFEKRGEGVYVSAGVSTDDCEDIVPKSNYVRGVNGPTGFIVTPCPTDSYSSMFSWILNTDLKGNLSKGLVNSNLTRTMIDFVAAMKRHLRLND